MEQQTNDKHSGRAITGLIIASIGSLILLHNLGLNIPNWIFKWSNVLILVGFFISIKHRFRNNVGLMFMLVGAFFTLRVALQEFYDIDRIGFPVLIIGVGLFLIFRNKDNDGRSKKRRRDKWERKFAVVNTVEDHHASDPDLNANSGATIKNEDYLESVSIFAGSHHVVFSKNFKGGEITAVFGGCDVNLTQADFDGQVVIDVTAIFGGAKLIVPAGWKIKQEVTSIFGGLDDKRTLQTPVDSTKILVIRGVALFGGIDIRSY